MIIKSSDVPVCRRCLYNTRHPFGLIIDENGICSGCRTHEEKTRLDWSDREQLLQRRLASLLGKRETRDYDCVVPVRGTPEYFKVLHIVTQRLGLRPLVVSYNSQFNSDVGIRNLDILRDTFDVDILHYTTNPLVYRKLVREAIVRLGSLRWPFLAGETQLPVRVAVDKRIPLVIWPTHQPTEQVGAHSYLEEAEMSRRSRHEYDLMRCEPQDMVSIESLLQLEDVADLHYPTDRSLEAGRVRGIYLANYYPWDSRAYSEEMVGLYGALCARNSRTFDTYERIDDRTYMTVHDLFKYARLGYSRVTDNLCREIRFGRISRSDAVALNAFFQAEYPRDEVRIFSDWLGIKEDTIGWLIARTHHESSERGVAPPLTRAQDDFVHSFAVNADPVARPESYVLFGKGLTV